MRHLGVEQTIKHDGKPYRLSRFTRRLLRLWLEWANSQIPSPLALAQDHFGTFGSPDVLVSVAADLMQHRYSFNDEAVWELWHQEEGVRHAVSLLFETHHPDADARAIVDSLPINQVQDLLAKANGVPPVDPFEVERQYYASLGWLPEQEPAPVKTMDWAEFDASLFQHLHLTPDQIDNMTPTEITVLCSKKEDGRGPSLQDGIEHAKLFARLTPKQQFELSLLKAAR